GGSPQVVVHDDAAPVQLDADVRQAQSECVGNSTGGQQHDLGADVMRLLAEAEADLEIVRVPGHLLDVGFGADDGAELLEVAAVEPDHVGLDHRQDLWEQLKHGDLRAQGSVEGAPLHAHHTAAYDSHGLRDFLECEDGVGVDRVLDSRDGDAGRHRAGGDDDVVGL